MSNRQVVQSLKVALADTYTLYFKTHGFHWNVTGPRFKTLHELFEDQYQDMWEALDVIAERVRQLGEYAPGNYDEMMKASKTISPAGQTPDAEAMVDILAEDNKAILSSLQECAKTANDNGDRATEDIMIDRLRAHEKAAWMLESTSKAA